MELNNLRMFTLDTTPKVGIPQYGYTYGTETIYWSMTMYPKAWHTPMVLKSFRTAEGTQ
jgi:hypothetical protein